ncbi:methyltransferase type 11 [Microthyrium microscopicum]|uniref:Methyltransferase type 11 n=1 Tax=Microthyrium microscopicum TaxID=703497 RepID=A0A6A6TXD4_9PEZI|nr:methyltransferase type 11 [Microthyrium microscopicum]
MAGPRITGLVRLFQLIWLSIQLHYAALKKVIREEGVTSLAHPQRIRDAALAKLLIVTSAGFIAFENTTNVPSLVSQAYGKILELGPGPGNQIHRYDQSRVEFIYAVDPNSNYSEEIAAKLQKADLEHKYKLLACGVEDSDILRREGVTEGSLDTVTSIQVLCSVGDVKSVMKEVYKLLKPGGSFIFWEHVKNQDSITALTQTALNPAFSQFVGCCLNRDIRKDILAAGEWENPGEIEVADDPYSYLPRISGILKKKA